MKILAFMQNQWLKDPERHKRTMQRYIDRGKPELAEDLRRRMIHYALFAGCRTGQILKKFLGDDVCSKIIWDEASKEVGGHSSSCFKADHDHMRSRIDEEKPGIVIAFGKIAGDALDKLSPTEVYRIIMPHPTGRAKNTLAGYPKLRRVLDYAIHTGSLTFPPDV